MLSFASGQSEGLVSRDRSEVIPREWPKSAPLICHLLVGKKKALNLWFRGIISFWGMDAIFRGFHQLGSSSSSPFSAQNSWRAGYGKTLHGALCQSNGGMPCLFFVVVMDHTVAACSSTSSHILHNLAASLLSESTGQNEDPARCCFLPPSLTTGEHN